MAVVIDSGIGTMESELVRLSTYSSFPVAVTGLWPSRLSRLGFHYDAVSGCVVCHRCRFNVQLPTVADHRDLDRRHQQQSPICRRTTPPPPETRDRVTSRDQPTIDVVDRHVTLLAGSSDVGEFGNPVYAMQPGCSTGLTTGRIV